MTRAVLDTNIFISSLFWRGAPYQVVSKGLGGAFTILVSSEILEEVRNVLSQKFKFPVEDTRAFIEVIVSKSEIVESSIVLNVVKQDPADNKIIECAVVGKANYIVSGDTDLLSMKKYDTIEIVTPNKFLGLL